MHLSSAILSGMVWRITSNKTWNSQCVPFIQDSISSLNLKKFPFTEINATGVGFKSGHLCKKLGDDLNSSSVDLEGPSYSSWAYLLSRKRKRWKEREKFLLSWNKKKRNENIIQSKQFLMLHFRSTETNTACVLCLFFTNLNRDRIDRVNLMWSHY